MICDLCPRRCHALRAENAAGGRCGMPDRLVIARAALHRWEEPCLVGANGAGAVFFSGCNLGCAFCQNSVISRQGRGVPISEERLREIFDELREQGAACLDLVTPTHFSHILARVLEKPVPGGLPVVWNSSAYERVETLRALTGKVQVYLPDLKYLDPDRAARYSCAPDYPAVAQAAIREMVRQRGPARFQGEQLVSGVLIRHLLLPGGVADAKRVMDWVGETFPKGTALFSLMAQYTPVGDLSACPEIQRAPRPSELRAAREYMRNLGLAGWVQDLEAVGDRFIPPFNLEGVESPPDYTESVKETLI